MEHLELVVEAEKVRAAFEKHHLHFSETHFGNFPRGACGNACCFLAYWLSLKGVKNIQYVCGERVGSSHAWLEIDNLIVDITSDQFPDGVGPVYVGVNRDFHDRFEDQEKGDKSISPVLMDAFSKFLKVMKGA